MVFENRQQAGRMLASRLIFYRDKRPIILALPRGGVVVGFEIAKMLHAPLAVLITRKIGAPSNSEFGIGAISEGNVLQLDYPTIEYLEISKKEVEEIIRKEKKELERRIKIYRNNKPLPLLRNKIVILVDDGVATGATARVAIAAIKKQTPKQIIFASPVCSYDAEIELKRLVDEAVCLTTPTDLSSIGSWYRSFYQVSDGEVVNLLKESKSSV